MAAISEQAKFLHRHGIYTEEQLAAFRMNAKQQIPELTVERKVLLNEKRRISVSEDRRGVICKQINDISEQLKLHRKDLKLCDTILKRSMQIAEKQIQIERSEQNNKQKVNKNDIYFNK